MSNAPRILLSACALAVFVLLNEGLAPWLPLLPFRLPLLLAIAFAAAVFRHAHSLPAQAPQPPPSPAVPIPGPVDALVTEVDHAVEHLRSAVMVLRVSEAYRQPPPPNMVLTLELVLKHLGRARQGVTGPDAPFRPALPEFSHSSDASAAPAPESKQRPVVVRGLHVSLQKNDLRSEFP